MAHRLGDSAARAVGSPTSPSNSTPGPPSRGVLVGIVAFVLFAILTIAWSFTSPIGSAPDEPHHIVKAAAVWRGEWLGTHAAGQNIAIMVVHVPETYSGLFNVNKCYRLQPDISAACSPSIPANSTIVPTDTHVGRYPPLYYLLVGWPTLLSTAESTIRWMRVVSCLLNSAILGFAFMLIRRYRMGVGAVVGAVCALTPVAIYMDSTVQPNGLEVSLAFLVSVAVIGLARFASIHPVRRGRRDRGSTAGDDGAADAPRPPTMLVNALGASASTVVLVRGLSPLWLGCIGVVALILIPASSWLSWLRLGIFRIWIAILAITSFLALAWIFGAKTLQIQPWASHRNHWKHATFTDEVHVVAARTPWFLEQMFGALTHDAQPGVGAYATAAALFCLLIVAGLIRGSWRERLAILFSVAATLAIPIMLAAPRVRADGINWQGRYIMPFAVEIAIVSGVAAFHSRTARARARSSAGAVTSPTVLRRVIGVLVVLVALTLEAVSFWSALRRYSVSNLGPRDLLKVAHPLWSPVLPVQVLAAGVPVLLLLALVCLMRVLTRSDDNYSVYPRLGGGAASATTSGAFAGDNPSAGPSVGPEPPSPARDAPPGPLPSEAVPTG